MLRQPGPGGIHIPVSTTRLMAPATHHSGTTNLCPLGCQHGLQCYCKIHTGCANMQQLNRSLCRSEDVQRSCCVCLMTSLGFWRTNPVEACCERHTPPTSSSHPPDVARGPEALGHGGCARPRLGHEVGPVHVLAPHARLQCTPHAPTLIASAWLRAPVIVARPSTAAPMQHRGVLCCPKFARCPPPPEVRESSSNVHTEYGVGLTVRKQHAQDPGPSTA